MAKYQYGWKPALPTKRFPKLTLESYPTLSVQKSLIETGFLPPIWDQGQTSSCTGHGTTRGIMYARAKQKMPLIDLSRLFPYWNARVSEGDPQSDSGAVIDDVVTASQKYGDCPYTDLPTEPNLVTVKPSAAAFLEAIQHKTLSAVRVLGADAAALEYHFKHCIDVLGLPVIFGVTVYESFESDQAIKTGIIPMPKTNTEQVLGGHCITGVAYDDSKKMVTFDNSWGTEVGQKGRFEMPYAYVFDPDLAADFRAITIEG